MPILKQKSSFGPGKYRGIDFSKERLQQFVDGTNKAIAAGIPIPLLSVKHATPGADDKKTKEAAEEQVGSGWVRSLSLNQEGSIEWEADVPQALVDEVNSGTKRFTSPEFRNMYESEKEGVYSGPIVRHITFTPLPGNPHQGAIETVALSERGVFQFSELDKDEQFSETKNLANAALKLGKQRNLSTKAKELHEAAYKASYLADAKGTKYHHSLALDAHHDAAKLIAHEGDSDVADVHNKVKEAHRKAGKVSQHAEKEQFASKQPKHGYNVGDSVHLINDVVTGGSQEADSFRKTLGKIKTAGKPGKVSRIFPNSGHVNVDFDGHGTVGVEHTYLKKHDSQHAEDDEDAGGEITEGGSELDNPELAPPATINPDMPPQMVDMAQLQAVLAGLNQAANVVLPSDWNPYIDPVNAMKQLMTGLNTALKAKQEAEMEEAKEEQEAASSGGQVVAAPMPYSEEDKQFIEQESSNTARYVVKSHSADAPKSGGGKYRRPVHVRVYDTHHDDYRGYGSWGAVKEFNNVDSRYSGHKSAHGQAKNEAHELASKLNQEHEDGSQHTEEGFIQFGEHHDCLTGYGYTKKDTAKGASVYSTDDNSHHAIIAPSGHWTHIRSNADNVLSINTGHGADSMKSHLEKVHGDGSQHAEDDLSDVPEQYRAIILKAKEDQLQAEQEKVKAQYAEQRAKVELTKNNTIASIQKANLPPALRNKLLTQFNEMQFSEGGVEPAVYTVSQVATLVSESLPKNFHFAAKDITVAQPPSSQQFFEQGTGRISEADAKALVDNNPLLNGSTRWGLFQPHQPIPTMQQIVADANAKHPVKPIQIESYRS